MLLQKTGWRIKQFISHRRNSSLEDPGNDTAVKLKARSASTNTSRRGSWRSQTQSPLEGSALRWACASTTPGSSRSPPRPTVTARSSASSLCSCDCASNPTAIIVSLSELLLETQGPEILYLPPLCSEVTSGDAATWRLIFSEILPRPPLSSSPRICSKAPSPEATFDLLEALEIDPVDHDKTPIQSIKNTGGNDMEGVSNDVDKLVREIDEAFQAVGFALADATAATQEWYDTTIRLSSNSNTLMPCAVLRGNASGTSLSTNLQVSRSRSVLKVKRRPFYRRKMKHSRLSSKSILVLSNMPERWALTDVTTNLVDVFSGKIFRIEVDEMLIPGRMQQLKNDTRVDIYPHKISPRSIHSIESNSSAPTKPFHSESLSARIDAIAKVTKASIPSPPPIPMKSDARCRKAGMVSEDLSFPPQPRKSSRPKYRSTPPLPTIPERSPLPIFTTPVYTEEPKSGIYTKSSSEYITLHSTPFTLTSPLFRHGSIRIKRTVESIEEEALDWTAFQMAISGTMNENIDMSSNMERELDEAELDDTMRWFAEFGFNGPAALMRERPKKKGIKVYIKDDNDQKRPWRGAVDCDKILVEGDLKGSPSSPMLDLAPLKAKRDSIIPLGYNLEHDLGLF